MSDDDTSNFLSINTPFFGAVRYYLIIMQKGVFEAHIFKK